MEQLSLKSFVDNGHPYRLYSYGPVANVPAGVEVLDAGEVIPEKEVFQNKEGPGAGSYSGFSNLFRYKLLFDKGGFWCDADVVCLRPFNIREEHVFASERDRESGIQPTTCVMKAPRGSALMRECYDEARNVKADSLKWGGIGPAMIARAVKRHGLEKCVVSPETFCPVDYWEFGTLVKPRAFPVYTRVSYGIHLWQEMWRRAYLARNKSRGAMRMDKDMIYGRWTPYGSLQKRYGMRRTGPESV